MTKFDEANKRLAALAMHLTKIFPPMQVAQLLAGAAFGVISGVYGPDKAREFFAELSEEIGEEARH